MNLLKNPGQSAESIRRPEKKANAFVPNFSRAFQTSGKPANTEVWCTEDFNALRNAKSLLSRNLASAPAVLLPLLPVPSLLYRALLINAGKFNSLIRFLLLKSVKSAGRSV